MTEYTLTISDKSGTELFKSSTSSATKLKSVNTTSEITYIKYHKAMYAPCRVDIKIKLTPSDTTKDLTYTDAENIRSKIMGQSATLSSYTSSDNNIATAYYVHEVVIEKANGSFYLITTIYSLDKLLDIVEECHSFVGHHLCGNIIMEGVERYTNGTDYTIETNASPSNLQFIGYKVSDKVTEFIQPYIVQYNETFYSMLARTTNRCGEYMYYEDGKLNVGLAYANTGEAIGEDSIAISSIEYPSVSTKSIFNNVKMFARNYSEDKNDLSAGDIVMSNLNNLLDWINSDESRKESCKNLLDEITKFKENKSKYYATRNNVEIYERLVLLKQIEENKLKAEPALTTDVTKYLPADKFESTDLTVFDAAINNADGDYNTMREERDKWAKEYIWDNEKDARYKELDDIPEDDRTEEQQDELDDLARILANQETYKAELAVKDNALVNQKNISDKITILRNIADYKNQLNESTDDKRTWNESTYTETSVIDNDWNTYQSDETTKIKNELNTIINDSSITDKDLVQKIYDLLNSGTDLSSLNVTESSTEFMYDYSLPVDEYLLEYTKNNYDTRDCGGYTVGVEGLAMGLKFLNTPGPFLEAAALVGLAATMKVVDMQVIQSSANSAMDEEIYDNVSPRSATDVNKDNYDEKEYKNGDTISLFSSFDNSDTAAMLQNINNAGLSVIRCYEENLVDAKLTINVDTANNTHHFKLGQKIKFEEVEYIVTNISGEYANSTPTETVEAVPVMTLESNKYCIPPMIPAGHVRYAERQTAKVKNSMDPQDMGRVRISYGWQDNDSVKDCQTATPFIRVATPFAAMGGGVFFQLAENEEVMIDYDHGNVERPYVSCSLYNGATKPSMGNDLLSPVTRVIRSQNGHKIVFSDLDDNAFITGTLGIKVPGATSLINEYTSAASDGSSHAGGVCISDALGFYKIEASTDQRAITLSSPAGSISLSAFSGISINSPYGDISIYGKNVSIKARNKVEVQSGISLSQNFLSLGNAATLQDGVSTLIKDFIIDLSIVRTCVERILEPVNGSIAVRAAVDFVTTRGISKPGTWKSWAGGEILGTFFSDVDDDCAWQFTTRWWSRFKEAYKNTNVKHDVAFFKSFIDTWGHDGNEDDIQLTSYDAMVPRENN